MAHLADIVIDCRHPASLARFWQAALDDYVIAPYDDEELARLATLGITDTEHDPTVLLERVDGARPRIWFQAVPETKVVKNRLHLDLFAADAEAEARRLVALGATRSPTRPGAKTIAMADPEGNEFCLILV